MLNGVYHIVIIALAVWGIVKGYRKGIYRLMGSVLAVAFGIVAVKMFAQDFLDTVEKWVPTAISGFNRDFAVQTLTCGVIYVVVVFIVQFVCGPVALILRIIPSGVISSIVGAVFKTFQYLMLVSIAYNLIADFNSTGTLARSAKYHDGNLVEGVMKIAPAVLGFPGGEDVGHMQQMEDAKKIS